MVTVIGDSGNAKDLDEVITHEVGHNWFYGILASNERDHPFMDEGLNSYYETRYMKQYYGAYAPFELPKMLYNPEKSGSLLENGYLMLARDNKDTPPDTHSAVFSPIAYGLQVYMKTALCMHWFEQANGTAAVDAAMQDYYRKWQFKHPYPEDFKAVLVQNGLKTDWLMDALQTKKRADYALKNVKKLDGDQWELTIQRKGKLQSPFAISAIHDGVPVKTQWYQGFVAGAPDYQAAKTQKITVSAPQADAFVIDRERVTLDLNRKNNTRRSSGLFPGMEPWQVKMLAPFQNTSRSTLGLAPWIGWNNADKTMLGLMLYNPPFPYRKLQVYLLPAYATASKSLVGIADVRYRFYPGGLFPKVTVVSAPKRLMKTTTSKRSATHVFTASRPRSGPNCAVLPRHSGTP